MIFNWVFNWVYKIVFIWHCLYCYVSMMQTVTIQVASQFANNDSFLLTICHKPKDNV